MNFVNLTPHTLNIHGPGGVWSCPPSGTIARVATVNRAAAPVGDIPTVVTTLGEVTGLPEPAPETVLIVSGMVATAAARADVFSPGDLVRDHQGRPIGCKGLRRSC